MKKHIIVLFLLSICFASCHDNLDKSIAEPLTVEELREEIKNDSTFEDFYNDIQRKRKDFFADEVNVAKYGEITYRRFFDLAKVMMDTVYQNKIEAEAEDIFKRQDISKYKHQLDSVYKKWKPECDKGVLNSYVPYEIRNFVKNPQDEDYIKEIIKKEIDPKFYTSVWDVTESLVERDLRKKDEECFEFLKALLDKH